MKNDECRMTNVEDSQADVWVRIFVIRHSSFVIHRHHPSFSPC